MMINSFQLVILFQTVFTHICCSQKASASVCYGKGVCSSFFGQRDSEHAVPHLVWFCQGWAETKTWASAAGLCSRWFQQTPESESQGSDKHCPFKSCPRSPDLSACVSVFLVQQPKTFSLFCAATRALRWRGRVYVFFSSMCGRRRKTTPWVFLIIHCLRACYRVFTHSKIIKRRTFSWSLIGRNSQAFDKL